MDKRIFGIETEFGISYSSPDSRPLPEEVARYLFRKVVSWGRSSNVFLTNGSRLYLDVGSHPEYATAECDDLAQLIAHDRAGSLSLTTSWMRPRPAWLRKVSTERSTCSRTTPTPPGTPTAAMKTTSFRAAANSPG